jgi:hypothetical protein
MNRLFKNRPGFEKHTPVPCSKRLKKNYKLNIEHEIPPENKDLIQSRILPTTASSKMLKYNLSKYSNCREDRNLPNYKTLDETSFDLRNENVEEVLKSNPAMRRSKTPMTFYKPSHNLSHYNNGEPTSYYGNNIDNR